MSDAFRYEQSLKKLKKNHFEKENNLITSQIEELFIQTCHSVSKDMAKEVFEFFKKDLQSLEGDWDLYFEKAFSFGEVLDLFSDQLEKGDEHFSQEFWVFLGEIINEFAPDLDMDVLQPLMSRLVDHKAL